MRTDGDGVNDDAAPSLAQDPEFLRYVAARVLSLVGSIITLIALPVLIYRMSGSAFLTALVAGLEAAPYALFGLVAGALSDRWNRKTVMVTADVLSACLVASIPLAYFLDVLTVPHVMAVAFLGPTIGTFFDGAVFGAVPMLVGRQRIAAANSYVWSVQGVVEIVMPSVVGVSLAVLHPASLLVVDALSFAASAFLIRGIGRAMHVQREHPALTVRQLGRDVKVGLEYLWQHAGVRTMTIVGFTQCIGGGGFVALMVVWADRQLDIGTEGLRFGLVYGAWAIGALIASVSLPRLLRGTTPAKVTLVALPFSAVLGVLTPVWDLWWVAALSLLVWSIAYTMVAINSISYRQQVTPEHLLGRVNTAGRMLAWGVGWTGGAFLAGGLSELIGLRGTLFVMTGVAFVGVVVAWTSPLRRDAGQDSVQRNSSTRSSLS